MIAALRGWWRRREAAQMWAWAMWCEALIAPAGYRLVGWRPVVYDDGDKPRYRYRWPEVIP